MLSTHVRPVPLPSDECAALRLALIFQLTQWVAAAPSREISHCSFLFSFSAPACTHVSK